MASTANPKMNAVYKPSALSNSSLATSSLANGSNLLQNISSQANNSNQQKNADLLQHLTAVASNSISNFKQSGLASWYDKKPHSHKTASGEKFDKNAMTGAKVNGKSVVIKINDRPSSNHSGGKSILDLSYGAAKRIGLDKQKLGKVVIERVKTPTNFVTYKAI
ncbi:MAG: hypothetical protein CR966_00995 [Pseudomonadales bacterium]|nr:MAG: hypothetical protein CR966_00995 [Pseudomonadales bacterium]